MIWFSRLLNRWRLNRLRSHPFSRPLSAKRLFSLCLCLLLGWLIALGLQSGWTQPGVRAAPPPKGTLSSPCPITGSDATRLIDQGAASYQAGKFGEALDCWQTAEKVAHRAGDRTQQMISQINQAQAMQAMGINFRACQTLLKTFGQISSNCSSQPEAEVKGLLQSFQTGGPQPDFRVSQTGLRSLGDVLRSLGYLELSEEVLQFAWTRAKQSPTGPERDALSLSLANTEHALSKRHQELYTRSIDFKQVDNAALMTANAALSKAIAAIGYYQQISQSTPPSLSTIQAGLNQLNLILSLEQWIPRVEQPITVGGVSETVAIAPQSIRSQNRRVLCNPGEANFDPNSPKPWQEFQSLKSELTRSYAPVSTQLVHLHAQLANYPATSYGALYAQLNFTHLLSQKSRQSQIQFQHPNLDLPSEVPSDNAKSLDLSGDASPDRLEVARQFARIAQTARQQGNLVVESYALGYLGELYLNTLDLNPLDLQQSYAKQYLDYAERVTLRARDLAERLYQPGILYQWEAQLGDIYRKRWRLQSDPELITKAIGFYGVAVNTLKSVRSDLLAIDPEIQFTFQTNVEQVYRNLIGMLLLTADPNQKVDPERLKQALKTVIQLQSAELENFLQCNLGLSTGNVSSSSQVKELVTDWDRDRLGLVASSPAKSPEAKVMTIYPIVLEDPDEPELERLEIILKRTNSEFERVPNPSGRQAKDTLGRTIAALRPLFGKSDQASELQRLFAKLYGWLIEPIQPYLKADGVDTLLFVPDSLLRSIPMGALYHQPPGSSAGRYLIEDYAIAVSLPAFEDRVSQGINPSTVRVLAAGVNVVNEECPTFSVLTHVDKEIAAIADVLKNRVTQLFNPDPSQRDPAREFTKITFQRALESSAYPIVHLATHGNFSSNPQETFILTSSGNPISITDLQEILKTRLGDTGAPIELLVLSACQTATGDSRAALGMAGVALRSGARSTLASLWSVDDASTSQLMQYFYEELSQPATRAGNRSKAKALQSAQLRLIANREKNYDRPYYWAPFVLIGSWR